MATMIWPSATRLPRAISCSREGWFHILRKRNEGARSEAIQSYAERLKSELLLHSRVPALAPVEDNAGDDEHRRHRQHLRKRLRGRPFGGFLHTNSLDLGRTHRCVASTQDDPSFFTRNTPRRVF